MGIGQKIKEYRIQKGLTQKDLADKLHVTYQAVSKWENDNTEPSFDTIKEMSKLFGCTIDELFDYNNEVVEEESTFEEKNIVVDTPPKILGVCTQCGKSIYESSDFNKVTLQVKVGEGKDQYTGLDSKIYCSNCKKKKEEQEKTLKEMKENRIKTSCRNRRIHSFVWPSIVSIIILIYGIVCFSKGTTNDGILSMALSVGFFLFLGCMILNNTFITDMWCEIASWGFVKLPGIIFELSFEGIIWLIGVKILFWILGFLLALLAVVAATAIAMVLSVFVYPFALRRNILCIGVE